MGVEIGLVERTRLIELIRAVTLAKELENAVVRFGENEITAVNMDTGATMVSYCKFSPEVFKNYSVEEPVVVNIPSSLIDLLKKFRQVDNVFLEVTEDSISIWRGDKRLKLIDIKQKVILEEQDIPSLGLRFKSTPFGVILHKEEEDPEEVASKYSYAQVALKSGGDVNVLKLDYVEFAVVNGMLVFTQVSEGETVRVSNVLSMDVKNAREGNRVRVATDLFKTAVESMIVKEFNLAIAKNRPVVLSDRSSLWEIDVLIAPVIPEEDVIMEE